MNNKRIYKIRNSTICGVCAGLGDYLNIDPVILRILFLIFAFTGVGVLVYLACALIMPYEDQL